MEYFEQSNLWKNTLAPQNNGDPYSKARERLRQSFQKTRTAVVPLVEQIAKELPHLTVHDVKHLDGLWHVADVLIGDLFDINPAEAFVLGITFLLHDAACSTFAFANGIDDLRTTKEWLDFVAQKKFDKKPLQSGDVEYQQALFETLRLIHPKQAEKLLTQSWKDLKDEPRYLMEDIELRNHYGRDIGKIAATHGKDAAVAEQYWANSAPLTPPICLELDANAEWKVDCLKIALLLRCIDAAHIDGSRAPDMLASFIQPTGESKNHWQFQNRLGTIGINKQNELYWSGQTFEETVSDAWWLCYETVKMIDREIRQSNAILKNNGRKEMRAKGAAGAQDISTFLTNVPVQGWEPLDIGFRISQLGEVVERFGGAKLYGDKPYLALRELIQNAADGIRARRIYRDKPNTGRIDIALTEVNGKWWLHVHDNGIGMSRYVLTEVLLDFGRSLWRDNSLREQWAGLASKGFEAIGQFGIGFFSVFMLGDEIKVTTWRDGDAESNQSTLHLRHRTNSKPMLISTPPAQRLSEYGTRVSVCLKNGRASLLMGIQNIEDFFTQNAPTRILTLSETVGSMAPALDIDVWCKDGPSETQKVIGAGDWKTLQPLQLLKRLAPAYEEKVLLIHAKHFSNIFEGDGTLVGRASMSATNFNSFGYDLGALTFEGIAMARWNGSGILLSGNNKDLARTLAQPLCSAHAMTSWGQTIFDNVTEKISPWVSNKFLSLGLPAGHLPVARLEDDYVDPEAIRAHLQKNEFDEILVVVEEPTCPKTMTEAEFEDTFKFDEGIIIRSSYFAPGRREQFGLDGWINSILPESDEFPRSVDSSFHRSILQTWPSATWKNVTRVIGAAGSEKIETKCLLYIKN